MKDLHTYEHQEDDRRADFHREPFNLFEYVRIVLHRSTPPTNVLLAWHELVIASVPESRLGRYGTNV